MHATHFCNVQNERYDYTDNFGKFHIYSARTEAPKLNQKA